LALFGTDPARNNVPRGQVCDRVATIQCASEQLCCNGPGRSFDDCKAKMKDGCVKAYMDDISGQPYLSGYDSTLAEPLFQTFEDKAKACDTGVTAWIAAPDGMRPIFPGTVDPGGKCTPTALELPQTNVDAAHLASCKDVAHTACLPHPPSVPVQEWTCAPRTDSTSPGACFTDVNCVEGMYCDNPNYSNFSLGPCRQRKAVKESCVAGNECASLLCKHGVCADVTQQNVYCLDN
jgi:hypothetical protein